MSRSVKCIAYIALFVALMSMPCAVGQDLRLFATVDGASDYAQAIAKGRRIVHASTHNTRIRFTTLLKRASEPALMRFWESASRTVLLVAICKRMRMVVTAESISNRPVRSRKSLVGRIVAGIGGKLVSKILRVRIMHWL